jgi:hypothetical protein
MIEENDEGDYSCKMSNSDGIEISKCQIEIERPKSRMESSLKSHNDQTNNRSLAQKFGFLKHVQSQNLIQGEQLILECSVYGDHPLDLIWLRNGKEIPENPDFIRETNGNNYKLTVKEVFPEDSGVFSAELFCATSNQAVMSACSIIIQGKDNDLINNDLKFIQFPISYNLDEGSSIKLDCKIKSNLQQQQQQQQSIKVKWFKNNEEIIESDRIKFINDNNNHLYSLNITTVLSTDDGQYYVVATNTTNGEEITAAFCLIVSFEINDSNLIDVKKILEKSIEHK